MASRSRFALLAVALITLNIAGLLWIHHEMLGRGRPNLRILSALPTYNIDQADRFSLLFDEPVGAKTAHGAAAENPPFAVQPQPKGHWTWSTPERLDFVLDEPLPPGRIFVIKPIANFESQTGRVLIGQKEFHFQTRPLRVESCEVGSADREQITIELTFNQPVAPADLLRHLDLVDVAGSQPLAATCLTTKPAGKLVIRCNRPSKDKVLVHLKADLAGNGGELPLSEPASYTLELPQLFCLLRADVQEQDLDPNFSVDLDFSQDLDSKQIPPIVEVTPPVKGLQTRLEYGNVILEGPFEPAKKYTVTIEPGLKSASGEVLVGGQSTSFDVPDRSPGMAFSSMLGRGTLMPAGQMLVDIKAVNLPGIHLTAHRVYANNLVAHVRGDWARDTSLQLWEKTIPLNLPHNAITPLALDLRQLLGEVKSGIYTIKAQASDCAWRSEETIVTISDLAITAKKERAGYFVWVTSIHSGKPLPEVQVTAMTRTNQTLATGVTDEQGLVRIVTGEDNPDGPAWLITAQSGEDLNYLVPEDHAWVLDRVDHSGKPYPRTYDVMLYTERGIYRPGDTIHITGLIRDAAGQVPAGFPLAVTLKRPDGKKAGEQVVTPKPDEQGFFHADFTTLQDGQLGRYTFHAHLPGAKEMLGETSALVEEYVPVRMEVKAEPTQPTFGPDQTPAIQVNARYLFGQPASQLPVKVTGTYKRASFESKQFAQYKFTDPDEGQEVELPDVEATLDEAGQATVEVPLTAENQKHGKEKQQTRRQGKEETRSNGNSIVDKLQASAGVEHGPLGRTVAPNMDKPQASAGGRSDGQYVPGATPESSAGVLPSAATQDSALSTQHSPPHGYWQAKVSATVSEPGGRSASSRTHLALDTAQRHIGLLPPASKILPADQPVQIQWIQLTSADELAAPTAMSWTLNKVDYDTTLENVGRRFVWKSEERLTPVAKGNIPAPEGQAKGSLEVTCGAAGLYRLDVADGQSGTKTRVEFYTTSGTNPDETVSMDEPERLTVVLDQEKYTPGSQAKVLIKSPFPGTLLLTLESDRTVGWQVVQMETNTQQVDMPIPETLRGGAFLAASVVRAVDPSKDKWLPHRAAGLARVVVDHKASVLPLTLEIPPRARPCEKIKVSVHCEAPRDAAKPACVHLWAVDEGILKTIAFKTPNPLYHFLAPHEAAVASADIFGLLLPDYQRPATMARIGGDENSGRNPRHSLVPTRRRESAVIWRTVVPVDAEGTATTEVDLPDLTGELRFMAVAADEDRYGSTQQPVTVTAPLLVEANWPRFAAPGDQFDVPVKVFNTTEGPLDVALTTPHLEGPIEVKWQAEPTLTVRPHEPSTIWLHATTTAMGQVSVHVQAAATSEGEALTATTKADLPIRPAAALHREVQLLSMHLKPDGAADKSQGLTGIEHGPLGRTVAPNMGKPRASGSEESVLRIQAQPQQHNTPGATTGSPATAPTSAPAQPLAVPIPEIFIPGTVRATICVGGRPVVQMQPALEQLIDYPYGCVEQTTSRLIALLYAPDLLTKESPQAARTAAIGNMIGAGIARLWSMQTVSGGLGYWPGDSHANLWGSAYAAGFLLRAQQAGYRVAKQFTDPLIEYLASQVQKVDERIDGNTRALLCSVLAGFGKPPHGWMNRLAERTADLDIAGRANLAAAFLSAGQRDRAAAILQDDTLKQTIATTTSGRLTSQVHQEAELLHVLLDLDPDHPWIARLVEHLQASRVDGRWSSTLENAAAVSALARYQLLNKDTSSFTGTVRCDQQEVLAFSSKSPASTRIKQAAGPIEVAATGTGNVYVSVLFEGLAQQGQTRDYDRQLTVRRRWLDRDGQSVDPMKIKVGDLIRVEVELAAPGLENNEEVDNIVVVDALPGGLEVENPRLATSADPGTSDEKDGVPDRVEFRDDRVLLFTSAGHDPRVFRYSLRAITTGQFIAPPIEASCMYDPRFASLNGGGKTELKR